MIRVCATRDRCSGCGTTPSFEIEIGYDNGNMTEKHRMCSKCIEVFQANLGLAKTQVSLDNIKNEIQRRIKETDNVIEFHNVTLCGSDDVNTLLNSFVRKRAWQQCHEELHSLCQFISELEKKLS